MTELEEARKRLGKTAEKYSDEELKHIYDWARFCYDMYVKEKQKEKSVKKKHSDEQKRQNGSSGDGKPNQKSSPKKSSPA